MKNERKINEKRRKKNEKWKKILKNNYWQKIIILKLYSFLNAKFELTLIVSKHDECLTLCHWNFDILQKKNLDCCRIGYIIYDDLKNNNKK